MQVSTEGPTLVGRIEAIWRYPIKSMAAEPLSTTHVSWQGLAGDRRWAFVREGLERSSFPWLTLRQRPDLNLFRPTLVDLEDPENSLARVVTPAGETLDVTDPRLAHQLWPEGARVIRQSRGVFDTFPLSVITRQSIQQLAELVGEDLDVQRFRPNLLVDSEGGSFPEDGWVGSVLQVGGVRMRIDKRDGRCAVITIDPETGARSPEILRAVAAERDGCMGVYGTTVEPGAISVGDEVWIEP